MTDFKYKIENYIKKYEKLPIMMSNEILVKNNISLKYLKKIRLHTKNDEIINLIKQNYPNVEIINK